MQSRTVHRKSEPDFRWNGRAASAVPFAGIVHQDVERTRMDVYASFADLSAAEREGIDFRIRVARRKNSRTVVSAPHGGGIEPGTSEVASQIADDDLSLAIFEGKKSTDNARLHISSTNFDERRCLALVLAADYVVAIHGEESAERVVYLGGRDAELGAQIRTALERHGYNVTVHENPELQGIATANICNRGRRGAGVQLELTSGLRKTFFQSLTAAGRNKPSYEFGRFAGAVREGLRAAGAL